MRNYLLKISDQILSEKKAGIEIDKIEQKSHQQVQEYREIIVFKNLFFVLCLFLFSLSFAQNIEQTKVSKSILLPKKTLALENIIYKTEINGKSIALDLYRPHNSLSEKLPVVVYIHGGGWVEGDKAIQANSYIENAILKLVEKKYAVISIDYRLVSETVHFPKPIEDCKDVIRWVRKNAVKYHFDINNIGLFGTSAGAHLALLSAYTNDNDFVGSLELARYSAKVNYVVDQFGPTDINKLLLTRIGEFPIGIMDVFSKQTVNLREKLINGISGFNINKDKRKIVSYFKTISPINYIDNAVPTLIQQGNSDKIVPFKQSKKLHRKLNKLKIQNYFTIVENGVHGFKTTDQNRLDEIVEELVNFIVSQKK
ncbi:alpha/beta hydrolase [Chryseobacterium sp. ISL-6]|uniref:alpha/beta hydrolase n=1 Tax=Chryseobacterium sp. ISL-6 TaxID=2819143 RepID=UPI001BE89E0E|nr:alpha/beta hydrolase [Chryseobacterium sp. ISL-6]MBT2620608.1 alpha/beta hydrolase [Chryseobacterium sp. ISL-6]